MTTLTYSDSQDNGVQRCIIHDTSHKSEEHYGETTKNGG